MNIKGINRVYDRNHSISLNSNQLKIIAMILMLIDHIGIMIIQNGMLYGYDYSLFQYTIGLPYYKFIYNIYRICRTIGRISFPIFTFCVVEGYFRTNNLFKYILRMVIFALISEIPFDLVVFNKIYSLDAQNVLWTYSLGLLMLFFMNLTNKISFYFLPNIIQILIIALFSYLAYFLKTDYSYKGIILIAIYYYSSMDRFKRNFLNFIYTAYMSYNYYFSAALSTFFINLYNGRKGRLNLKYIFYWFYPIHLLILFLIVYLGYLK